MAWPQPELASAVKTASKDSLTAGLKSGPPKRVKILRGASGAALDEFEDWRYSSSVGEDVF